MKKGFVRTQNIKNFIAAMHRLQTLQDDIPRMALVYSDPGIGKTEAALWWAVQNPDAVFIRTKKLMTGRWLLEEIVAELGEAPLRRVSDLFRQCVEILLDRPRMIFVDEIDYLTHDARVIETLRDIHDITGTPIIFIGMGMADKKLKRYTHLYDRFSEILKFQPLTETDVRTIANEKCEIKLSDDAIKLIHKETQKFRKIVVWMYKAERIARTNNLKIVTAEHLQAGRRK